MNITKKDVEYVAALARLSFEDEEKEKYAEQLNVILEYVNKLNQLDTEGVKPTSHAIPIMNAMRDDEVKPSIDRQKALQNAPEYDKGCFKVPKILE